ncbi:AbrB family transcriptional regulator [Ruminococcaceae bacterium OttesenSCG-928-L11]|nr:AbrB family transcriptional regulator [Ruminococcaceae bacterium OttesenSCG-928-L11]
MNTKIARIDAKGRVYIPKALRTAAGMEQADFVKLGFKSGTVIMSKVLLVEAGDQSPEARTELTRASIRLMDRDEIRALAKYILELEETR